jgi:hypothetical protein
VLLTETAIASLAHSTSRSSVLPATAEPQLFTRTCDDERKYAVAAVNRLQLRPLTSIAAARMVFEDARPGDFYPILIEREVDVEGEGGLTNFRPIRHRDVGNHDAVIEEAGARKTFWNLVSYRPSAIRRKSFTWKKTFAQGLHGVFIDFDCGRQDGDAKCNEPGAMLTQVEVWSAVVTLVEEMVLPPFQMWSDGTRGCYGVMLFENPHTNIEGAAEEWRDLRGYFYRRAKHIAADEKARAITQPLKAPEACGVVRYYSTGAAPTSLSKLLEWFHEHPHATDLVETATATLPFTVEQDARLTRAWSKHDLHTKPRGEPTRNRPKMTWRQKVGPSKARIDDFKKFVKANHRYGYSRRQFFLDLASAVKSYELARDSDGFRAYGVAMEICGNVNATLEKPLSEESLQRQVYAADPNIRRSSDTIRRDMGITELISEQLGLRTLIPPSLRVDRLVRDREEKAHRAEQRLIERRNTANQKEAAKLQKKLEREEERRWRSAQTPKKANGKVDPRGSASRQCCVRVRPPPR